jgi:hypothetical protein
VLFDFVKIRLSRSREERENREKTEFVQAQLDYKMMRKMFTKRLRKRTKLSNNKPLKSDSSDSSPEKDSSDSSDSFSRSIIAITKLSNNKPLKSDSSDSSPEKDSSDSSDSFSRSIIAMLDPGYVDGSDIRSHFREENKTPLKDTGYDSQTTQDYEVPSDDEFHAADQGSNSSFFRERQRETERDRERQRQLHFQIRRFEQFDEPAPGNSSASQELL